MALVANKGKNATSSGKLKIAYLGAGTWGSCLASILAMNGHEIKAWDRNVDLLHLLSKTRQHPKLPGSHIPPSVSYVDTLEEAIEGVDLIVEGVTSSGVRSTFELLKASKTPLRPIIITSKGIEQHTGLLLPEVALDVFGKEAKNLIGCLSGPSHAEEVVHNLPASVVCSAYHPPIMTIIQEIFSTPHFRIYPNQDILGVSFGGAMKNVVAIACGISDGLHFGDSAKAALVTRGLHEMRKLATAKGSNPETLNGLSGLGDLCVTCFSAFSRNYSCGRLIAEEEISIQEAQKRIGMVVEGAYTCVSAWELGQKLKTPVPITDATYSILYKGMSPKEAVTTLFQRAIKEEHL